MGNKDSDRWQKIGDYEYKFHVINNEDFREYCYPNGDAVRIESPKKVWFRRTQRDYGGDEHRVLDANGDMHLLPPGWICLTWRTLAGVDPEEMSF